MRDLARVQVVTIDLDDNRYLLRSDMANAAHHAFAAAGLRPPSPVTLLGPPSGPLQLALLSAIFRRTNTPSTCMAIPRAARSR